MATIELPILQEKREPIVVAHEEKTALRSAAEVETKAEVDQDQDQDQDQQGIDFVTLGMFIIGRLSLCQLPFLLFLFTKIFFFYSSLPFLNSFFLS